jgi:tetratricopeptide (TPR) repeat protein
MKAELIKQFSEATKLQDAGQLEAAKNLLLELAGKDTPSMRILAALGLVSYELGLWDDAASVFESGTQMSPDLESVSKGLFHSLWKQGKLVEALEEVKRFQSISDSEDYQEIIREINEKW